MPASPIASNFRRRLAAASSIAPPRPPAPSREAALRGAAGQIVLLYLPTYSPWLNPLEMLWRHFRREVTHCELFESVQALLRATSEFFATIGPQNGCAPSLACIPHDLWRDT